MRAHFRHWPDRLPHQIPAPATSLWMNLAISALRYPDKTALQYLGTAWSYRRLHDGAEALAAGLQVLGVRRGDRVMLDMQNCPQLVMAHCAILRLDAVVVPVNPMNRADELQHYIRDPQARVALITADLAPELARANAALPEAERLQHMVVTQFDDGFDPATLAADDLAPSWHDWLLPQRALPTDAGCQVHAWAAVLQGGVGEALAPVQAGPDDLAVLPYTSGTTGLPKGCMHTHGSIMHNVAACAVWGVNTAGTVNLAVVPMFHITGMVVVMHTSLYLGATMVLMPRWDREVARHLFRRWQISHWTNIPTMVIDLLANPNLAREDLLSLKMIGGGGAAMPEAVAQRLLDDYGLRYQEGYGLTETAAPSHNNPSHHPKKQCLGIPFVGVDARVVNPDTLEELPVGESGEIVISGPQVFKGYWQRPEATAAAFFEREGKRFFRSGDMGRVDEDGYFFMTDRLKRMINASGFKVWPAEVEALMFKHPKIQEACVIGTHDPYRGESVKAVVVLRQGQSATPQEIIDWCREHMAAYKVPRVVALAESLPKSGSGKVMWRLLQEQEAKTRAAG